MIISRNKQIKENKPKLYTRLKCSKIIGNIYARAAQLNQFTNVTREIPFVGNTSDKYTQNTGPKERLYAII